MTPSVLAPFGAHMKPGYGLGGPFTLARHDRHDQAVEILDRALDLGVTYIDTSAFCGDGASELNVGTVMRERRNEVFLASKSHNEDLHPSTAHECRMSPNLDPHWKSR